MEIKAEKMQVKYKRILYSWLVNSNLIKEIYSFIIDDIYFKLKYWSDKNHISTFNKSSPFVWNQLRT